MARRASHVSWVAFGRPKDPRAAAGRLKILNDYILNNSKILLDTVWISYINCDEQKILEKVFFFVSEKCRLFNEVSLVEVSLL